MTTVSFDFTRHASIVNRALRIKSDRRCSISSPGTTIGRSGKAVMAPLDGTPNGLRGAPQKAYPASKRSKAFGEARNVSDALFDSSRWVLGDEPRQVRFGRRPEVLVRREAGPDPRDGDVHPEGARTDRRAQFQSIPVGIRRRV